MTTATMTTPAMTAEAIRADEAEREVQRIKVAAAAQGAQQLALELQRRETIRSLIARDALKAIVTLRFRCAELLTFGPQVKAARECVEAEIVRLRKELGSAVDAARAAQAEANAHQTNTPALAQKARASAAKAEQQARNLGSALNELARAHGTITDIGKAVTIARAAVNEFAQFEPGK